MKFVVFLFCVVIVQSYRSKYCEICRNHTLCKYPVGGPTAACQSIDNEASLSDVDKAEIINRINSRRNLVALGHLKTLSQAANMRKVQWSTELASFAQRWADQCDSSVKPNREDECRDLVKMHVGQNIAAVLGLAPGLNVKSFVDMWFMLKLHYEGSVVYYNESRDYKTNYFTQLIWADTEYVGCGKVKFFNHEISTFVERLVCNFAPKGNNHGKPVYVLGFPATQCPEFTTPDLEFLGLCKQDRATATEIAPEFSASLLRIVESSNSSAKQDLDPNYLKQINPNSSKIKDQRKQKLRHTYLHNSNGAIKRDSFHMQNSHINPLNEIENFKGHQFTPERGHSRMYHGNLAKIEPIQNFQTTLSFSEPNIKRFDITTTSNPFSIQHNYGHVPNGRRIISNDNDYAPGGRRIINNNNDFALDDRRVIGEQNDYAPDGRRNFCDHSCTRKPKCNDCFPKPYVTNQCTRGQSHSCNSCLKPQPHNSCLQPPLPPLPPSLDLCPCKAAYSSLAPVPVPLPAPVCPVCPSRSCAPSESTSLCAKRRAQGNAQDTNKSTQYNYYDMFPNIGLRSGDENQRKPFDNTEIESNIEHKAKESEINNQVKEIAGNLQMSLYIPQDSHDVFYSSERKRRDFEDQMTFKPFWQMDEYNYKRQSDLKSLRYTTLADKRNKKNRWTTTSKLPTESITIKSSDKIIRNGPHREHVTEKYLSFEELMHLRKLSTLEALDYEMRRFGDEALRQKAAVTTTKKAAATTKKVATTTKKAKTATSKKAAAATTKARATTTKKPATTTTKLLSNTATTRSEGTTTITANTPFIRLKQCTRKITCTWTALMFLTGSDGSPLTGIPNGVGGVVYNVEVGSRTPRGYVDGCTRTSTCTRDFMDRNKMPVQTTEDDSSSNDFSAPEDEEYCERRSLNVQRRNLEDSDKVLNIEFQEALTELTLSYSEISHVTNRGIVDNTEKPQYKYTDCICYEDNNSRNKRDENSKYKDCNNAIKHEITQNQDTDDIYSMLRKMTVATKYGKKPHRCACNGTKSIYNTVYWGILLNYSFIWTYHNIQ